MNGTLDRRAALDRPSRAALTDVAPLALSVAPFGVVLGITVHALAVGDGAGVVGAAVVYAGSAQLTAVTLMDAGVGVLTVLLGVLMVNARLLMYGAALEPLFRGQPAWFRWTGPQLIVDQTYLAAAGREDLADPARFRRYWLSLGGFLGVAWVTAVSCGVLAAPMLPELHHVRFAGTACFIGLLMPRLSNRPAVAAAVCGGLVAAVAAPVAHSAAVLLGTIAGVVAGVLGQSRWSR